MTTTLNTKDSSQSIKDELTAARTAISRAEKVLKQIAKIGTQVKPVKAQIAPYPGRALNKLAKPEKLLEVGSRLLDLLKDSCC